jgi:hypothetical protein
MGRYLKTHFRRIAGAVPYLQETVCACAQYPLPVIHYHSRNRAPVPANLSRYILYCRNLYQDKSKEE